MIAFFFCSGLHQRDRTRCAYVCVRIRVPSNVISVLLEVSIDGQRKVLRTASMREKKGALQEFVLFFSPHPLSPLGDTSYASTLTRMGALLVFLFCPFFSFKIDGGNRLHFSLTSQFSSPALQFFRSCIDTTGIFVAAEAKREGKSL